MAEIAKKNNDIATFDGDGPDGMPGKRAATRAVRFTTFAEVAKYISQTTGNGIELVDFALAVMRNDKALLGIKGDVPMTQRMTAHHWLADRCIGKPVQMIQMDATMERSSSDKGRTTVDLSSYSEDELKTLHRLLGDVIEPQPPAPALPAPEAPSEASGDGLGGSGTDGEGEEKP